MKEREKRLERAAFGRMETGRGGRLDRENEATYGA